MEEKFWTLYSHGFLRSSSLALMIKYWRLGTSGQDVAGLHRSYSGALLMFRTKYCQPIIPRLLNYLKALSSTIVTQSYDTRVSGGFRGGKAPALWRLVMYFCIHNCTSPSKDYAAVACSNNNQAQLHTHESVPY